MEISQFSKISPASSHSVVVVVSEFECSMSVNGLKGEERVLEGISKSQIYRGDGAASYYSRGGFFSDFYAFSVCEVFKTTLFYGSWRITRLQLSGLPIRSIWIQVPLSSRCLLRWIAGNLEFEEEIHSSNFFKSFQTENVFSNEPLNRFSHEALNLSQNEGNSSKIWAHGFFQTELLHNSLTRVTPVKVYFWSFLPKNSKIQRSPHFPPRSY